MSSIGFAWAEGSNLMKKQIKRSRSSSMSQDTEKEETERNSRKTQNSNILEHWSSIIDKMTYDKTTFDQIPVVLHIQVKGIFLIFIDFI